jgi:hypothetical protein
VPIAPSAITTRCDSVVRRPPPVDGALLDTPLLDTPDCGALRSAGE